MVRALILVAMTSFLCGCGATQWQNYLEEHSVDGRRHRPDSAQEVLEIVRTASANHAKVRAVGSGHSSSEVAQPRRGEAWIDVDEIDDIETWPYYRDESVGVSHVRVGAGATIREINRALASASPPRALHNMGNYDAQTIAGAFSTGTHGSGLNHGPLTERIAAIEMVTDEILPGQTESTQRLLRIEPTQGVSNPETFASQHATYGDENDPIRIMELVQDDAMFDAALISLGCFGVITSVTVETREPFWLREVDTLHRWDSAHLPNIPRLARSHPEFLQLTLVPHRILDDGGSHVGEVIYLQTVRTEEIACDRRPPRRPPSRDTLGRALAATLGTGFLEDQSLNNPWFTLRALTTTFEQRLGGPPYFASRSDLVLINSLAPEFKATSIDIQVPLDQAAAAIDRVVELAEQNGTALPGPVWEEWWHTSPLGIRFVGASRALLAPSYDGPRASIEIPLLYDLRDGTRTRALHNIYRNRMMKTLEHELTQPAYGGRPHWGQRNWMTAPRAREMYGDRWDCWVEQYRRFNGNGTFDNAFTDRMCLSDSDDPVCADIEVAGVCGVDDAAATPDVDTNDDSSDDDSSDEVSSDEVSSDEVSSDEVSSDEVSSDDGETPDVESNDETQ